MARLWWRNRLLLGVAAWHDVCMKSLLHFCKFLLNPNSDLEPISLEFGRPMNERYQRYIVRTENCQLWDLWVTGGSLWPPPPEPPMLPREESSGWDSWCSWTFRKLREWHISRVEWQWFWWNQRCDSVLCSRLIDITHAATSLPQVATSSLPTHHLSLQSTITQPSTVV